MICVSIQDKDLETIFDVLDEAHVEMAEIRLDRCPQLSPEDIEELFSNSDVPLIATCRISETMPAPEAEARLITAIKAGAAYVDLEIEAPPMMSKRIRRQARESGTVLIRSYHDFETTDSKAALEALVEKCQHLGAEVVKIVTLARDPEDVRRVLSLYDRFAPETLVAFCMGEEGRQSRLECLRRGAPYTYAAYDEAVAPGQWPLEEMYQAVYGDRQPVETEPLAMPSSKSFAQRAIIAAALADGTSHLTGYTPCGDNEAALACKSIQKDATRHYAVYTNEMGRLHHLQNYVRENLNSALASRHIKVYYQPIIHALSGKVCGFEALARWESPDYGLLSPAVFIPVLEEARLIDKLDRYIVERVAENLHDHIKQGQNLLPISVNLSRIDFQLFDPVAFLEDVLHRYQLARHLLCLEITENALVLQDDAIRQGLRHLQQEGCKVWLDDFGSGYSSLNVLKDYRFHTLKLDMAFLHPFTKESRTIVTSIIRMAKELGIHTLAEGVETKEQAEFLRDIGCEKLQGFYYGRPLPGRDCYAYCRERGMEFETMQEVLLLSQAGLIDVSQPTPISIIYDDSVDLQFLQVNQAYLKALQSMGTKTMTDSNRFLLDPDYPMHRKFRRFADQAIKSGRTETMTYVDNGQYMRVNLRTIARVGHHYIHRAELAVHRCGA